MNRPIKQKERETIIQSLKSGVVPRAGLHHIQVGRSEELKSFIKDVDNIAEGGIVVCEHPFGEELEEEIDGLVKQKEYKYSKVAVTLYRKV